MGPRYVGAGGGRIGLNPETIFARQGLAIFAGEIILGFQTQFGADFGSTFSNRGKGAGQADAVGKFQQLFVRGPVLFALRGGRIGPEATAGAHLAERFDDGVIRVDLFALQDVLVAVAIGDFDPNGRIVAEVVEERSGIALFGRSGRLGSGALGPLGGPFRLVVGVVSHDFSLL